MSKTILISERKIKNIIRKIIKENFSDNLSYFPGNKYRYKTGGPHKHYDIPEDIRNALFIKNLGQVANKNVILVDGGVIRDHIDVDFTTGGNPEVYGYVPEDELWVEAHVSEDRGNKDIACSLLHEAVECELMYDGLDYNSAHEEATKIESIYRHKEWDVEENKITELIDMIFNDWNSKR